jgi:hypothetical protein
VWPESIKWVIMLWDYMVGEDVAEAKEAATTEEYPE